MLLWVQAELTQSLDSERYAIEAQSVRELEATLNAPLKFV